MSFRLYQSEGCHLCALAKQLIAQTAIPALGCELIDIAYDDQLMDRFGEAIPVLEHNTSGRCLYWPFDLTSLKFWLAHFEHDTH